MNSSITVNSSVKKKQWRLEDRLSNSKEAVRPVFFLQVFK